MGLFRKKDRVLDLTKKYKQDQERIQRTSQDSEASPLGGGFGIFGDADQSSTTDSSFDSSSEGYVDFSAGEDGRKKKLAKRLMDITDRLEDLSNQIYHLQQRLELLEKKLNVGGY